MKLPTFYQQDLWDRERIKAERVSRERFEESMKQYNQQCCCRQKPAWRPPDGWPERPKQSSAEIGRFVGSPLEKLLLSVPRTPYFSSLPTR